MAARRKPRVLTWEELALALKEVQRLYPPKKAAKKTPPRKQVSHAKTVTPKKAPPRRRVSHAKTAAPRMAAPRRRVLTWEELALALGEVRRLYPPKKAAPKKAPKKAPPKRVSHAKKASRFWKHFARDGRPVPPWEISVGPGLDIEDVSATFDGSFFVEEDYDYEDFDTDWGGYEYEDTGYPDEDA